MTNKNEMFECESLPIFDSDGRMGIKKSQTIDMSFVDFLRDLKEEKQRGEMQLCASVPTLVVEMWLKEGFNIYDNNIKARDIIARLKRDGLDHFVATRKQV